MFTYIFLNNKYKMSTFFLVFLLYIQLTASTKDQIETGVESNKCENYNQDFANYSYIRPIAEDNTTHICYWAFSQGPCAEGEWFSIDAIRIPNQPRIGKCETRRCGPLNITDWEFPTFPFLYNKLCMTTDDINVDFCGSNSPKVYYGEGDTKPICSEFRPNRIEGRFLGSIFKSVVDVLARRDPASVASKNASNQHKENIKGWK